MSTRSNQSQKLNDLIDHAAGSSKSEILKSKDLGQPYYPQVLESIVASELKLPDSGVSKEREKVEKLAESLCKLREMRGIYLLEGQRVGGDRVSVMGLSLANQRIQIAEEALRKALSKDPGKLEEIFKQASERELQGIRDGQESKLAKERAKEEQAAADRKAGGASLAFREVLKKAKESARSLIPTAKESGEMVAKAISAEVKTYVETGSLEKSAEAGGQELEKIRLRNLSTRGESVLGTTEQFTKGSNSVVGNAVSTAGILLSPLEKAAGASITPALESVDIGLRASRLGSYNLFAGKDGKVDYNQYQELEQQEALLKGAKLSMDGSKIALGAAALGPTSISQLAKPMLTSLAMGHASALSQELLSDDGFKLSRFMEHGFVGTADSMLFMGGMKGVTYVAEKTGALHGMSSLKTFASLESGVEKERKLAAIYKSYKGAALTTDEARFVANISNDMRMCITSKLDVLDSLPDLKKSLETFSQTLGDRDVGEVYQKLMTDPEYARKLSGAVLGVGVAGFDAFDVSKGAKHLINEQYKGRSDKIEYEVDQNILEKAYQDRLYQAIHEKLISEGVSKEEAHTVASIEAKIQSEGIKGYYDRENDRVHVALPETLKNREKAESERVVVPRETRIIEASYVIHELEHQKLERSSKIQGLDVSKDKALQIDQEVQATLRQATYLAEHGFEMYVSEETGKIAIRQVISDQDMRSIDQPELYGRIEEQLLTYQQFVANAISLNRLLILSRHIENMYQERDTSVLAAAQGDSQTTPYNTLDLSKENIKKIIKEGSLRQLADALSKLSPDELVRVSTEIGKAVTNEILYGSMDRVRQSIEFLGSKQLSQAIYDCMPICSQEKYTELLTMLITASAQGKIQLSNQKISELLENRYALQVTRERANSTPGSAQQDAKQITDRLEKSLRQLEESMNSTHMSGVDSMRLRSIYSLLRNSHAMSRRIAQSESAAGDVSRLNSLDFAVNFQQEIKLLTPEQKFGIEKRFENDPRYEYAKILCKIDYKTRTAKNMQERRIIAEDYSIELMTALRVYLKNEGIPFVEQNIVQDHKEGYPDSKDKNIDISVFYFDTENLSKTQDFFREINRIEKKLKVNVSYDPIALITANSLAAYSDMSKEVLFSHQAILELKTAEAESHEYIHGKLDQLRSLGSNSDFDIEIQLIEDGKPAKRFKSEELLTWMKTFKHDDPRKLTKNIFEFGNTYCLPVNKLLSGIMNGRIPFNYSINEDGSNDPESSQISLIIMTPSGKLSFPLGSKNDVNNRLLAEHKTINQYATEVFNQRAASMIVYSGKVGSTLERLAINIEERMRSNEISTTEQISDIAEPIINELLYEGYKLLYDSLYKVDPKRVNNDERTNAPILVKGAGQVNAEYGFVSYRIDFESLRQNGEFDLNKIVAECDAELSKLELNLNSKMSNLTEMFKSSSRDIPALNQVLVEVEDLSNIIYALKKIRSEASAGIEQDEFFGFEEQDLVDNIASYESIVNNREFKLSARSQKFISDLDLILAIENKLSSVEGTSSLLEAYEEFNASCKSLASDNNLIVNREDDLRIEFYNYVERVKQSATQIIRAKLLSNSSEFKNIFETQSGSTYFVSHDGSSIRIRKEARSRKYSDLITKTNCIYFISEEQYRELSKPEVRDKIDNGGEITIKPMSLSEGAIPIEFIHYEITSNDDNRISLKPTSKDAKNHIGNRVSKILQQSENIGAENIGTYSASELERITEVKINDWLSIDPLPENNQLNDFRTISMDDESHKGVIEGGLCEEAISVFFIPRDSESNPIYSGYSNNQKNLVEYLNTIPQELRDSGTLYIGGVNFIENALVNQTTPAREFMEALTQQGFNPEKTNYIFNKNTEDKSGNANYSLVWDFVNEKMYVHTDDRHENITISSAREILSKSQEVQKTNLAQIIGESISADQKIRHIKNKNDLTDLFNRDFDTERWKTIKKGEASVVHFNKTDDNLITSTGACGPCLGAYFIPNDSSTHGIWMAHWYDAANINELLEAIPEELRNKGKFYLHGRNDVHEEIYYPEEREGVVQYLIQNGIDPDRISGIWVNEKGAGSDLVYEWGNEVFYLVSKGGDNLEIWPNKSAQFTNFKIPHEIRDILSHYSEYGLPNNSKDPVKIEDINGLITLLLSKSEIFKEVGKIEKKHYFFHDYLNNIIYINLEKNTVHVFNVNQVLFTDSDTINEIKNSINTNTEDSFGVANYNKGNKVLLIDKFTLDTNFSVVYFNKAFNQSKNLHEIEGIYEIVDNEVIKPQRENIVSLLARRHNLSKSEYLEIENIDKDFETLLSTKYISCEDIRNIKAYQILQRLRKDKLSQGLLEIFIPKLLVHKSYQAAKLLIDSLNLNDKYSVPSADPVRILNNFPNARHSADELNRLIALNNNQLTFDLNILSQSNDIKVITLDDISEIIKINLRHADSGQISNPELLNELILFSNFSSSEIQKPFLGFKILDDNKQIESYVLAYPGVNNAGKNLIYISELGSRGNKNKTGKLLFYLIEQIITHYKDTHQQITAIFGEANEIKLTPVKIRWLEKKYNVNLLVEKERLYSKDDSTRTKVTILIK